MMRIEEYYVGRRAMKMKVQGRRKRGRPKRRWLERRDCRLMMCTTVLIGDVHVILHRPHIKVRIRGRNRTAPDSYPDSLCAFFGQTIKFVVLYNSLTKTIL